MLSGIHVVKQEQCNTLLWYTGEISLPTAMVFCKLLTMPPAAQQLMFAQVHRQQLHYKTTVPGTARILFSRVGSPLFRTPIPGILNGHSGRTLPAQSLIQLRELLQSPA